MLCALTVELLRLSLTDRHFCAIQSLHLCHVSGKTGGHFRGRELPLDICRNRRVRSACDGNQVERE